MENKENDFIIDAQTSDPAPQDTRNPNIGFLITNVRTANGALPVEGATVNVFNSSAPSADGNIPPSDTDIIYSMRTNRAGVTEKVALATKSKELSTEPGNVRPFLSYNIAVSADGFYDTEFINVPIFPGITSIQTVDLMPVSEFGTAPNGSKRYVEVPDNKL